MGKQRVVYSYHATLLGDEMKLRGEKAVLVHAVYDVGEN